jgi:hypothetical protein
VKRKTRAILSIAVTEVGIVDLDRAAIECSTQIKAFDIRACNIRHRSLR